MDPSTLALYIGKEIGKAIIRSGSKHSVHHMSIEKKMAERMWNKFKQKYRGKESGYPEVVKLEAYGNPYMIVEKKNKYKMEGKGKSEYYTVWSLQYECPECKEKSNHVYKPKVLLGIGNNKSYDRSDMGDIDEDEIHLAPDGCRICLECGGKTDTRARCCPNCDRVTAFRWSDQIPDNPPKNLRRPQEMYCFNCSSIQESSYPDEVEIPDSLD